MEVKTLSCRSSYEVRSLLDWAEKRLESRGIPASRQEAEILLAHVLKVSRLELLLNPHRMLNSSEVRIFKRAIGRREKRVPLQYIIGKCTFRYLDLEVNPKVFIPRPETELVVEEAIKLAAQFKNPRVLDLGTGSGAIALSIAYEVKDALVYATDISKEALAVATKNANYYNLSEKVIFIQSNLFQNLPCDLKNYFDIIVSNPPYVSFKDKEKIQPEVKNEPQIALGFLEDDLYFHKRILMEAPSYLKRNGYLLLEIGASQIEGLRRLLSQLSQYKNTEILKDFNGYHRFIRLQI